MATTDGPPDHPLIRAILQEAHRFSFFQAVAWLERSQPDSVPVGGVGPAGREAIRFRPDVQLGFPASSLVSVEWIEGDDGAGMPRGHYRVTASFLGLYGADSPLPPHWSVELLHEVDRDTTVRDFLDLFHHRIYSLFHRAWSKYRYPAQYRSDGSDAFTKRIFSLIGLGEEQRREAGGLPVLRLLRYGGLLVQRPGSAAGLERILSDWFEGVGVRVTQCVGRWFEVGAEGRSRLGQGACTLGGDCILGGRVWDVSGSYRIGIGPVDIAAYRRLLPGGTDHITIEKLTRLYLTDRLEAELEVHLEGPEVPPLRVASEDSGHLGWTSWLVSRPSENVAAVFPLGGTDDRR